MTLLYIDDDAEDIEFFCDAIKNIHPTYLCLVAQNAKDGLHILETLIPDVIFLDINMPVMNGKEALRAIRSQKNLASVPVCMLSTTTNSNEINMCRELGANECIVKPNSFAELCNTLKSFFQMNFLLL
jgi:CheY-like chemotaxis protein